jgi:hypothetical protein
MQALFCAVVETRDPGQAKETRKPERDLIVIFRWIGGIKITNAFLDVMIIEERDEVTRGVAVGTSASTCLRNSYMLTRVDGGASPFAAGFRLR